MLRRDPGFNLFPNLFPNLFHLFPRGFPSNPLPKPVPCSPKSKIGEQVWGTGCEPLILLPNLFPPTTLNGHHQHVKTTPQRSGTNNPPIPQQGTPLPVCRRASATSSCRYRYDRCHAQRFRPLHRNRSNPPSPSLTVIIGGFGSKDRTERHEQLS